MGDVVAIPSSEKKWKVGDRVGGAWSVAIGERGPALTETLANPSTVYFDRHGGHDGTCRACARGQFQMCDNRTVNGAFREGGYGQYATLRTEAAAS